MLNFTVFRRFIFSYRSAGKKTLDVFVNDGGYFFLLLQNEGSALIARRNEVQQKLCTAVDVFILEVDELPLGKRLKALQVGI